MMLCLQIQTYNVKQLDRWCPFVMQTSGGEEVKVPGSEPITQERPVSPDTSPLTIS